MRFFVALVLVLAGLAGQSAASDSAAATQARTYYESIDMSSPTASLDGFIDAYRSRDFQRAFFLLSPGAQAGFLSAISGFDFSSLLHRSGPFGKGAEGYLEDERDSFTEVISDISLIFDGVMFYGAANGLLPFTFGPAPKVADVEQGEAREVFAVETGGEPANLRFDLVRTASGRWKVDRISWAGSSERERPWGLAYPD